MSNSDITGDALLPEEQAYFESQGHVDIPSGDQNATAQTASAPASDGKSAPVAAAQESQTDNAPSDDGAGKQDDKRTVDYRALKEERQKRREIEHRLNQITRDFDLVSQRLNMIMAAQQQAMAPQVAQQPQMPPRPEEDLISALDWTQRQVQQLTEQQIQEQRTRAQQDAVRRQQEALWNEYKRDLAAAVEDDPDYEEAYNYTLNQVVQEHMALGLSREQAIARARQGELALADEMFRQRKRPSQAVLQIARARGWRPKAEQGVGQAGAAVAGQHAQSTQPAPAERLQAVAQGQAANASLSAVGGSAAARPRLDARALASMSDEEFAETLSKIGERGFRTLAGG